MCLDAFLKLLKGLDRTDGSTNGQTDFPDGRTERHTSPRQTDTRTDHFSDALLAATSSATHPERCYLCGVDLPSVFSLIVLSNRSPQPYHTILVLGYERFFALFVFLDQTRRMFADPF